MRPRHFGPIRHWLSGFVVAVVTTGLTFSGVPVAQAAPSDWTIVAHRGGSKVTPESTLAAFRYMLLRGVDAVEFDISFTRDGVPVLMHDSTLNRTTNCRGAVASISLAALKKCDAGSWFGVKFAGERVPTVTEALRFISARTKNFTYFLHMKITSRSGAAKIRKIVLSAGLQSRVVPISNSPTELAYLKQAGFTRVGLVFNTPAGWSSRYKFLIPYNVTSNPRVVATAQKRGQQVFPVEDHPHSLGALAGLDVDGVLANNIDKALILAGRLARPPGGTFQEEDGGDPEPTVIPAGESRTTGPNDF